MVDFEMQVVRELTVPACEWSPWKRCADRDAWHTPTTKRHTASSTPNSNVHEYVMSDMYYLN